MMSPILAHEITAARWARQYGGRPSIVLHSWTSEDYRLAKQLDYLEHETNRAQNTKV